MSQANADAKWLALIDFSEKYPFGAVVTSQFMFMARGRAVNGKEVFQYKHRNTRRYLNIDSDGRAYKYVDGTYLEIPAGEAVVHALS